MRGLTYSEIGSSLGLSRQRVQQLVRPPAAIYRFVHARAHGRCETCHVHTRSGHVHHKSLNDTDNYNDVDNLAYLCVSCHRIAHNGGSRKLPEFKRERIEIPKDVTVIQMPLLDCKQCEHTWVTRLTGTPKCCPRCKSRKWQDERKQEKTR